MCVCVCVRVCVCVLLSLFELVLWYGLLILPEILPAFPLNYYIVFVSYDSAPFPAFVFRKAVCL